MLPYKSSSLVQNVFAMHRFAQGAADWRSGPRWSILSVLSPVHPFATTWHFPSRGNEKIGGTGYCVTYDTDSQSRNADFILIAREGDTTTLGAKGPVKLKNPWAEGPSILRTFPSEPSETCGLGPLWYCVPPSRPAGKRVTGFSVAYGSLRIQFPCHRKRWGQ